MNARSIAQTDARFAVTTGFLNARSGTGEMVATSDSYEGWVKFVSRDSRDGDAESALADLELDPPIERITRIVGLRAHYVLPEAHP